MISENVLTLINATREKQLLPDTKIYYKKNCIAKKGTQQSQQIERVYFPPYKSS